MVVSVPNVPKELYSLWIACGPLVLLLVCFGHGTNSTPKELHFNGSLQLGWIWTQ